MMKLKEYNGSRDGENKDGVVNEDDDVVDEENQDIGIENADDQKDWRKNWEEWRNWKWRLTSNRRNLTNEFVC